VLLQFHAIGPLQRQPDAISQHQNEEKIIKKWRMTSKKSESLLFLTVNYTVRFGTRRRILFHK
jgi:hypothetical protein